MVEDGPLDILVVDDLPEKRLAFQAVLEPLQQRLTLARSGAEALRAVLERDFAVILLDVNLPDIDGLEVARLIREHKRCRETPILFVSAFSDPQQVKRAYALGAVDYIADPSVPEVLRTKVKVFVELMHAQRRSRLLERERLAATMAQEANRRKDDFIAMLSHELRNPLTPLRNVVHILRKRLPDDPAIESVCGILERQVLRMTALVDDLLDMARITQGKVSLALAGVDLREVLKASVETVLPFAEQRGQRLSVELGEAPLGIEGDAGRLTQVFCNLLNNACKYTPEGGEIELRGFSRDGAIEVTVRDTGIGIEPELLARVFDLFVQTERARSHSQGGLGIGLTLVKDLVEMHRGMVELHSEGAGRGTFVRVRLPADPGAQHTFPAWQPGGARRAQPQTMAV